MALRYYLVPAVSFVSGPPGVCPKYFVEMGVSWSAMDYGFEPTYLVGADLTAGQHATLVANPDVIAIPANIDQPIGGALATVQTTLEDLHIPAGWVTAGHTYREVIRLTGTLFLFLQRFSARQLSVLFTSGITLNTQISELTSGQRAALIAAADSLSLNTTSITGATSLRQALKIVADQLPSFSLAGQPF